MAIKKDRKIITIRGQAPIVFFDGRKKDPVPIIPSFVHCELLYPLVEERDVIMDRSGKDRHSAIQPAGVWVDGKFGKAIEFDGDDYIDTGYKPTAEDQDNFTVISWIKMTGQSSTYAWLGYTNNTNAKLWCFMPLDAAKEAKCYWEDGTNGYSFDIDDDTIEDNTWHMISWACSPESNSAQFFTDLSEQTKNNVTSGSPTTQAAAVNLCVGALNHKGGFQNFFRGTIDMFMFFSQRLTENEITSLYNFMRGV